MYKIIDFTVHGDKNGNLISLEQNNNIPFEIKRMYYIYGTGSDITRGHHAHKKLKQVLVAISGSCDIKIDNGKEEHSVNLSSPEKGLLIDSVVWREMSNFSSDCVLVVLADSLYEEGDYLRDYDGFIKYIKKLED